MSGVVLDIQNAISAVTSTKGYSVSGVYLFGESVGGGPVLQVASERNDVKGVVAVSPYVGADVIDQWYVKLGKPHNDNWNYDYTTSHDLYGTNYSTSSYTSNSPIDHISGIQAPVLLLQGTGDERIIWQTVQEFANDMTEQHKKVKLDLVSGGQHALDATMAAAI